MQDLSHQQFQRGFGVEGFGFRGFPCKGFLQRLFFRAPTWYYRGLPFRDPKVTNHFKGFLSRVPSIEPLSL